MTFVRRFISVVRWILRRDASERELHDELETYIEMSAAEKVDAGIRLAEARRLARLELGGIEQVKERVRTSRHGAWLDEAARDIRYALRTFKRTPTFVSVVVVTLALGIGANTAIFSLVDALMLRWLPVPDPQELLQLKMRMPHDDGPDGDSFSYALVRALADQRDLFADVAGYTGYSFTARSGDSIRRVPGAIVTGGYYDTLKLTPALGRLLTRADDERGAPLSAVISDGYWQRQFARAPDVVGRTLILNGEPVTIVGVTRRGFEGANVGSTADVTMTIGAFARVNRMIAEISGPGNFWLRVLARPAPGVSIPQTNARLALWWPGAADSIIASHWPAPRRQEFAAATLLVVPGGTGWTFMREMYREPLLVLMGMVAIVLLVSCANVASLMLARSSARQREIGVRLAMGAGRGRIIRQLLIESALLSLIGAAVGVLAGWASSRYLVQTLSAGPFPVAFDVTPNGHVLAFTGAVSVATAILFGLAPAFQTSAVGPLPALKDDGRMTRSRSRGLSALITVQVALSLLLLAGAGLFVRTLQNLQHVELGFDPQGVLLVDLQERRTPVPDDLLETVRHLPGVTAASVSTHTPLSGSSWSDIAVPRGQPLPDKDTARFVGAGPAFFETMRTPLLAGRAFSESDTAGATPVAIVNETFATRYFPDQRPLGQILTASVQGNRRDLEIIGVARDTRAAGLRREPPPTVYVPYAQLTGKFSTTMEVRVEGSPDHATETIGRAIQQRLPDTLLDLHPLSAQVGAVMVRERMMATLATAFGVLAVVLACVGLYGLEAYSVARRTRELGVRIALGAQRGRLIGAVLANAMGLVGAGILVGLCTAWAALRGIRSLLFGLTPSDPATMAGAAAVLLTAAALAAYLPARRASRVDPLVALRHD